MLSSVIKKLWYGAPCVSGTKFVVIPCYKLLPWFHHEFRVLVQQGI